MLVIDPDERIDRSARGPERPVEAIFPEHALSGRRTERMPVDAAHLDGVDRVACPRHAARVDIRSGGPLTPSAILPVAAFPVVVQDDRILVELDL